MFHLVFLQSSPAETASQVPWFWPGMVTIVAATIAVIGTIVVRWLTHRAEVRQKAWATVYAEKRADIRRFVQLVPEWGSKVLLAGEATAPCSSLEGQRIILHATARRHWATRPNDLAFQAFMSQMMTAEQAASQPEIATKKLETALQVLLNSIDEDLNTINLKISALRTSLNLSAFDPQAPRAIHQAIIDEYERIHATPGKYHAFDYPAFGERFSRGTSPGIMELRRDLTASAQSLRQATRMNGGLRRRLHRRWKKERAALTEADGQNQG